MSEGIMCQVCYDEPALYHVEYNDDGDMEYVCESCEIVYEEVESEETIEDQIITILKEFSFIAREIIDIIEGE